MTISALTVWEARSTATGSMVNGGGFVTGASGVDYSQQNAAQYALTGVTTAAADAILLSASAATDMVGNICRIVSGTNFTTGWYEIISVVAGVSITVDRNATSAAGAAGVVNIGGALSLNSTLDDDFFEQMEPGNTLWVKSGSYSLGENVSIAKAGTATSIIKVLGYDATRGDAPTGSNRPLINGGSANAFLTNSFWVLENLSFVGGPAILVGLGASSRAKNCKAVNNSTTATRSAFSSTGAGTAYFGCEAVSIRGNAVTTGNTNAIYTGCYFHDSVTCGNINQSGSQSQFVSCIFARPSSTCVTTSVNAVQKGSIQFCTLYGSQAQVGTGISIGSPNMLIFTNSIVYGLTTGVAGGAANTVGFDDYNCYNNNGSNVDSSANWQIGPNSVTTNPAFTNVTEITGTGATTSNSGNTLVDSGATFVTAGITVDDYVHIISTSGTVGKYTISSVDSETQITLGQAPGNSSANVSYSIGRASDFSIGAALAGFPGLVPGTSSTGYSDMGAVQHQSSSSSASSYTFGG